MDLEVREVDVLHNSKERAQFVDVPWKIYESDPNWVPPLRMSIEDQLKPAHPFYENAEIRAWIAFKEGRPVGRIAAIINHAYNKFHEEKIGFFGYFESVKDDRVCHKLLERAQNSFKNKGMKKVLGPINLSTNYECGLLVEGFKDPPQVMMTYNPPYYKELLEHEGYHKAKDLFAYQIPMGFKMPEVIEKIAERTQRRSNLTWRKLNKKNWESEVQSMFDIYNDAWEKNWGFVPMTEAEFKHTAKDLKMIADEDLILFAEVNGEPVGFIVTLPDLNQVFHKVKSGKLIPMGLYYLLTRKKHINRIRTITLGVKKDYRKMGLEALMYKKAYDEAHGHKAYKECEMSWILEDNLLMNKPLVNMGAIVYKTYRIFEKKLS